MATFVVSATTAYTVTEANAAAQGVTGYNLKFGAVSGTYTISIPVPASALTAGGATGLLSSLSGLPGPGAWFGAASAINATGEGPVGAPFAFTISLPLPTAPTLSFGNA